MAQIVNLTGTTELEAVNAMLASIGEAPLSSLDGATQADVQIALNILRNTAREVQMWGWRFNLDFGLEIPPWYEYDYTDREGTTSTLQVFRPATNLAAFEVARCPQQQGSTYPDMVLRPAAFLPSYIRFLAGAHESLIVEADATSLIGIADSDTDLSVPWPDTSGHVNNFGPVTSLAGTSPRFLADCGDGTPALEFTSPGGGGPSGDALESPVLGTPTDGMTYMIVAKQTGAHNEHNTFFRLGGGDSNRMIGSHNAGAAFDKIDMAQWHNQSGGGSVPTEPTKSTRDWFVYTIRFNSVSSAEHWFNGESLGTFDPTVDADSPLSMILGTGFNGLLKSVRVFDRAITNSLRILYEQDMGSRHNITVTNSSSSGISDANPLIFYDRAKNRDGWDVTERQYLYIDALSLFPFEKIPESCRWYIMIRACRRFAQQVAGSDKLASFNEQDEAQALRALKRDQGENDDYNILDNMDVAIAMGRPRLPSGVYDPRSEPGARTSDN